MKEVNDVRRDVRYELREDVKAVKVTNDAIYGNKRNSFTKNQIVLGGIPIYVDEEFRNDVIPVGTQNVELFYDVLKEVDCYEYKHRDKRRSSVLFPDSSDSPCLTVKQTSVCNP